MWDSWEFLGNILGFGADVASVWPIKSGEPLQLHNTLSGKLEPFAPLSSREVKMYNCGPTVYDRQHIGNMFAAILPDTLRRALEAWGYKVKQVINITDFGHLVSDADLGEDKMSKGLEREGLALTMENMHTLAEKYTALYLDDIAALGIDTKKILFPRASQYIPEQIALIKTLEQKGYAYKTSDGVYFDTKKFADYGKLGNINLAGQEAGARVEQNPEKKNPTDFALWKYQPEGENKKEKLGWESPWGRGFPGWHIECTAMIFKLLGKQIDIHTGGIEHIPVHHNNEIAQAEVITGKQYVKYWLHNAHITIEGKKYQSRLATPYTFRN
jgi:cysteinyl-tRNA synthetase